MSTPSSIPPRERRPMQPTPGPSLLASPVPSSLRPSLFRPRPSLLLTNSYTFDSPELFKAGRLAPVNTPASATAAGLPSFNSPRSRAARSTRNPFERLSGAAFDSFVSNLTDRIKHALEPPQDPEPEPEPTPKPESEPTRDVFGAIQTVETDWTAAASNSERILKSPPVEAPLFAPESATDGDCAPHSPSPSLSASATYSHATGQPHFDHDSADEPADEYDSRDVSYEVDDQQVVYEDNVLDHQTSRQESLDDSREVSVDQHDIDGEFLDDPSTEDEREDDAVDDDAEVAFDRDEREISGFLSQLAAEAQHRLSASEATEADASIDEEAPADYSTEDAVGSNAEDYEAGYRSGSRSGSDSRHHQAAQYDETSSETASKARHAVESSVDGSVEDGSAENVYGTDDVDDDDDDEIEVLEVPSSSDEHEVDESSDERQSASADEGASVGSSQQNDAKDEDGEYLGTRIPYHLKGKQKAATPDETTSEVDESRRTDYVDGAAADESGSSSDDNEALVFKDSTLATFDLDHLKRLMDYQEEQALAAYEDDDTDLVDLWMPHLLRTKKWWKRRARQAGYEFENSDENVSEPGSERERAPESSDVDLDVDADASVEVEPVDGRHLEPEAEADNVDAVTQDVSIDAGMDIDVGGPVPVSLGDAEQEVDAVAQSTIADALANLIAANTSAQDVAYDQVSPDQVSSIVETAFEPAASDASATFDAMLSSPPTLVSKEMEESLRAFVEQEPEEPSHLDRVAEDAIAGAGETDDVGRAGSGEDRLGSLIDREVEQYAVEGEGTSGEDDEYESGTDAGTTGARSSVRRRKAGARVVSGGQPLAWAQMFEQDDEGADESEDEEAEVRSDRQSVAGSGSDVARKDVQVEEIVLLDSDDESSTERPFVGGQEPVEEEEDQLEDDIEAEQAHSAALKDTLGPPPRVKNVVEAGEWDPTTPIRFATGLNQEQEQAESDKAEVRRAANQASFTEVQVDDEVVGITDVQVEMDVVTTDDVQSVLPDEVLSDRGQSVALTDSGEPRDDDLPIEDVTENVTEAVEELIQDVGTLVDGDQPSDRPDEARDSHPQTSLPQDDDANEDQPSISEEHVRHDIELGKQLHWQADTPPMIEEDDEPRIEVSPSPEPVAPFPDDEADAVQVSEATRPEFTADTAPAVPDYVEPSSLAESGLDAQVAPIEQELDVVVPTEEAADDAVDVQVDAAHIEQDIKAGREMHWQPETPPLIEEDDEPRLDFTTADRGAPAPFPADVSGNTTALPSPAPAPGIGEAPEVPGYVEPETMTRDEPEPPIAPITRDFDVRAPDQPSPAPSNAAFEGSTTPRIEPPQLTFAPGSAGDGSTTPIEDPQKDLDMSIPEPSTTPVEEPPLDPYFGQAALDADDTNRYFDEQVLKAIVDGNDEVADAADHPGTTPPGSPPPEPYFDERVLNAIVDGEADEDGAAVGEEPDPENYFDEDVLNDIVDFDVEPEVVDRPSTSPPDSPPLSPEAYFDLDTLNAIIDGEEDVDSAEIDDNTPRGSPKRSPPEPYFDEDVLNAIVDGEAADEDRDASQLASSLQPGPYFDEDVLNAIVDGTGDEEDLPERSQQLAENEPVSSPPPRSPSPSSLAPSALPSTPARRSKRLNPGEAASDEDVQTGLLSPSPTKRTRLEAVTPHARSRKRSATPDVGGGDDLPRRSKRRATASPRPEPVRDPHHHHRHSRQAASGPGPRTRGHCGNVRLEVRSRNKAGSAYVFSVPSTDVASSAIAQSKAKVLGPDEGGEEGQQLGGHGESGEAALEDEGADVVPDDDVRDAVRRIVGPDLWHEGAVELLEVKKGGRKKAR